MDELQEYKRMIVGFCQTSNGCPTVRKSQEKVITFINEGIYYKGTYNHGSTLPHDCVGQLDIVHWLLLAVLV